MVPARRRRARRWAFLATAALSGLLFPPSGLAGSGVVTPPPLFFAARVEGFTVRPTSTTSARTVNPGSGYSVADLASTAGLDGSRSLQMKAVGSTNDPGDLGGAALFADPDSPTASSTFPNYAEAFFPSFEAVGQSQVSEKCAINREPRAEPACRQQAGPYAFAKVTPDGAAPVSEGFARNSGHGDSGETTSRAEIRPTEDGGVAGTQINEGRDLGVAGTPIRVESFLARSSVVATYAGVEATGECNARTTVGGVPFESDPDLQALLGPFSKATGITVKYTPPTKPVVNETFGGTKEVSCTGARFEVSGLPGGTSSDVTYGSTYSTASPTSDRPLFETGLPSIGDVSDSTFVATAPGGFARGPVAPLGTAATDVPAGPAAPSGSVPAVTSAGGGTQQVPVAGGGGLVARRIATLPLAMGTAVAASLLPLGIWLLLGVVGSLARGLPSLRLPPFRDPGPA